MCDYSDAYILLSGTIIISERRANQAARQGDERNKGTIFKDCTSFTDFISQINNTQVDNAIDIDVVIPMSNLIEYCGNYSKASGSLSQYYTDKSNAALADFGSLKSIIKITRSTPADGNTKIVEIPVPLK